MRLSRIYITPARHLPAISCASGAGRRVAIAQAKRAGDFTALKKEIIKSTVNFLGGLRNFEFLPNILCGLS